MVQSVTRKIEKESRNKKRSLTGVVTDLNNLADQMMNDVTDQQKEIMISLCSM